MIQLQSLEELARQAIGLASNTPANPIPDGSAEAEVARILQICNACRYCEGFCAVFPAMTRRIEFPKGDMHYLANLCHQCGACLHACQYAPPHDFGVNVPRAMSSVRMKTYSEYAWPAPLGKLYQRNGLAIAIALSLSLAIFLALAIVLTGSLRGSLLQSSGFYDVFPHGLMVSMFLPVFTFSFIALGMGLLRFWRDIGDGPVSTPATVEATRNVLTLKYLDGGHGKGCNEESDAFTLKRRRYHHFTFYGFVLCFMATSVATLYHYLLGWHAPYGYSSLPKLLGIIGGTSLLFGSGGLLVLGLKRHPLQNSTQQRSMDLGFVILLNLIAASGLVLMLSQGTLASTALLCMHLGTVMALFLTLPYGKFSHGLYRSAALLKWSIEKRKPSKLKLGDD